LNPEHLVGGALKLNAAKARAALEEKIAKPLGLSLEAAAYGAHQIAASNMIRAIKAVSTERGRDPREFSLFAFGGNGPLFACGMAEDLGVGRVVIPPSAGLFSSFGLLYADVEHHYGRSFRRLLRKADLAEIGRAWDELSQEAIRQLESEGFTGPRARLKRSAALHYRGQSYDLVVPVPEKPFDTSMVAQLEEAFGREHERTYGHRAGPEEPVELVTIQVVGQGLRQGAGVPEAMRATRAAPASSGLRRVYLGGPHGWAETPILGRSDLDRPRQGPFIIEEYDSTTLVRPTATARLDAAGNIIIDVALT
ncbi:MAG: hydantoinase/oxoprolinase family protein, partial [Hyphomicrobiaceae bacterium]